MTRQNGPYLYTKTSATTPVYLKNTPFSLSSYIQNVMGSDTVNENNTAYNVTFYWNYSSSFVNSSGNISTNFTNITDDNLHYNDINLSFVSLDGMSQGSQRFYVRAYGYNLSNDLIVDSNNNNVISDSVDITFLCYNDSKDSVCVTSCGYLLDPDCTQPATNTNIVTTAAINDGGGKGDPTRASDNSRYVEKLLQTQEMYELVRGFDNNFTLTVENPFDGNLKDVKVDIKGFLSQYLKVEPDIIPFIQENSSSNFTIVILAPKYFARGTYNLNMTITGLIEKVGEENNQTWTSTRKMKESRLVTLMIHEVSRNDADKFLNDILSLISSMSQDNINVDPLRALYEQAQKSFKDLNYEDVKTIYEQILLGKENAYSALALVKDIEERMNNAKAE